MKSLKTIILAGVAAAVAAAPASAAPFGRDDDRGYDNRGRVERIQTTKVVQRANGRQVVKVKQVSSRSAKNVRSWRKGERFDSRYAANYRVIGNPRAYRLYDAPRGYRWVQSNHDAVLVAITSGLIGAVLGNVL